MVAYQAELLKLECRRCVGVTITIARPCSRHDRGERAITSSRASFVEVTGRLVGGQVAEALDQCHGHSHPLLLVATLSELAK